MRHQPTLPGEYREEDRGHDTPCWIWQRGRDGSGYGAVWYRGRVQGAHRVYYTILAGSISDGLQLDHLCRVHACVNPDHLEPVTQAENIRRGAGPKLDVDRAAAIRRERIAGTSQARLAEQYGVSEAAISFVINGRTWRSD